MPTVINFTQKALEGLEPREKLYEMHDKAVRGLLVQVRPTSTKTFYLYRKVKGRPERIKIGNIKDMSVEQARKEAQRLNGEIAKGSNPQDIKRAERAEITFGDFFEVYMEKHSRPHKKASYFDQEQYDRHLKKAFATKKLSAIRKVDMQNFHNQNGKDSGHHSANRLLAMISSIFGKAIEWDYYSGTNPTTGVKRFVVQSRERFMTPEELPKFFQALEEEENPTIRDFFKMSLFTGARKSNVLAMRWDDVDLERAVWRIPMTKNGQPQNVPLVVEAVELLKGRKTENKIDSSYVFAGSTADTHLQDPKRGWRRMLKRAGFKDLRIHDLRRTMGSWQAAAGVSLQVIGKTLGHKTTVATQVYARLDIDPVREAMSKAVGNMVRRQSGGN